MMIPIRFGFWFLILLQAFGFLSCRHDSSNSTYVKDGKTYGRVRGNFTFQWYSYYERGLSFGEGGFLKEAARDLQSALEMDPTDRRMANTYGLHFIDYFPHRELGILFYQQGRLEPAQKELELSIRQYPSAKARFYLDRVRKGLLTREAVEKYAPVLALNFEKEEIWTRNDPVLISGSAEDARYVSSLHIAGKPVYMEGAEKRISFSRPMDLTEGKHNIEVVAKNLLGKISRIKVIIHVDRQGPVISVEDVTQNTTAEDPVFTIKGMVYDEAGLSAFSLNDISVETGHDREIHFSKRIRPHLGTVSMVAIDKLGNRTSAQMDLKQTSAGARYPMIACSGKIPNGLILAGLFGPKDKTPPQITLKGWQDSQAVYLKNIYLDGNVSDDSPIEKLTINGQTITAKMGKRIFFNHILPLEKGENSIVIEAKDEAGKVANREFVVTRLVPKALQLSERLSMSVMGFEERGGVSNMGASFPENLTFALVNQNRFRVVERDRLDVILQEHKISGNDLFDKRTALQVGKLVAAQTILTGKITETRMGIEIMGRVVDTETSDILAYEDVYSENKGLQALKTMAQGLAIKIHRKFPLLTGLIIKKKDNYIYLDIGAEKLGPQRRLLVFHEEEFIHPVTKKSMGSMDEIVGRVRVVQAMPQMCKAEIVGGDPAAIKTLDKVISE